MKMKDKEKTDFGTASFQREPSLLHREAESKNGMDGSACSSVDRMKEYLEDREKRPEREEDPALRMAVYLEQGAFYRANGMYQASMEAYKKAGQLIASCIGTGSLEYASVLNNMAGTCFLAGRYGEALEMYEEAAGIYTSTDRGESAACAGVYSNIARAAMHTGQFRTATGYLEKAFAILSGIPGREKETMIICSNLTSLCWEMEDSDRTMYWLDRALGFFEDLPAAGKKECVPAMRSLAGILYGAGSCERAIELYCRAAESIETCGGKTREYGEIFQSMYWVYRRMGDRESAVRALGTAKNVYTELLGAEDERTRSVEDELMRVTGNHAG